jgi:hypothetical protein
MVTDGSWRCSNVSQAGWNTVSRGRILERNWDKSLKSFLHTPRPLQKWFQTNCNGNIVYGNLKYEKFQDYAQKLQPTFMYFFGRPRVSWPCRPFCI